MGDKDVSFQWLHEEIDPYDPFAAIRERAAAADREHSFKMTTKRLHGKAEDSARRSKLLQQLRSGDAGQVTATLSELRGGKPPAGRAFMCTTETVLGKLGCVRKNSVIEVSPAAEAKLPAAYFQPLEPADEIVSNPERSSDEITVLLRGQTR